MRPRRTGAVRQTLPRAARRVGLGTTLRRRPRPRADVGAVLAIVAERIVAGAAVRAAEAPRRTRSRPRVGVANHADQDPVDEEGRATPVAVDPGAPGGGTPTRSGEPEGRAVSTQRATRRARGEAAP